MSAAPSITGGGMNSGAMDVLFSRELPHDVRHLANILRQGVIAGAIDPFACHIIAQDGTLMNEGNTRLCAGTDSAHGLAVRRS